MRRGWSTGFSLVLGLVVAACANAALLTVGIPGRRCELVRRWRESNPGRREPVPGRIAVAGGDRKLLRRLRRRPSCEHGVVHGEARLPVDAADPARERGLRGLLKRDGLTVELIHQDDGVSLDKVAPTIKDRTLLHGMVKAGVIVDDLDATVAWLRAQNVPIAFGPFPATLEQPANLIIADNEGNLIQFIARKRARVRVVMRLFAASRRG